MKVKWKINRNIIHTCILGEYEFQLIYNSFESKHLFYLSKAPFVCENQLFSGDIEIAKHEALNYFKNEYDKYIKKDMINENDTNH